MTDHRAELHRRSDGSVDIVVSEAIDTGSAAIAALVSEVNKGNKVTINNNTDVTSVTEGAQLRASCDDARQRGAIAPSRPSANERIDDSTPLSKVARVWVPASPAVR